MEAFGVGIFIQPDKAIKNNPMKIIIILLTLFFAQEASGQRTSVKGYRYEKTIKQNPNLSVYKKGDKKLYVIWKPSKVFIYPNPTQGVVYFSDYGDVVVRDFVGRVLKVKKNIDQIDLSNYPNGTYYITIITNDYVSHHLQVKL
jgi:hypothetical protein